MMVTVVMFHRVVIYTNPDKTKYMVCTPSLIWGKWSEETYK